MKRILLALSIVAILPGCRGLIALLYLGVPNPDTPAKAKLKGKTIVVMTTIAPGIPDRHIPVIEGIVSEIRKALIRHYVEKEDGGEEKKIVSEDELFAFRDSRPKWGDVTRAEMAEHFKADHVIEFEARRFAMNDTGPSAEFRAVISGTIRAVDVKWPDEAARKQGKRRPKLKVALSEEFSDTYPPRGQFVMDVHVTPELFIQRLQRMIGMKYALWFYPHPSRERSGYTWTRSDQ